MLSRNHPGVARFLPVLFICCQACSICLGAEVPDADQGDLARRILADTGVQGGLVVHLGCGDGKLTAALRGNDSYLVQGLDADSANVEKARDHIRSLGLYGGVSVERHSGKRLPYTDNLVNLFVSEDLGEVPMNEVMRVLTPNGVAYVKQNGKCTKTVKPRPKEIDDWSHHLHGPDNNAVANDTVVGPPRRLKWVSGPLWARSHEFLSSLCAMVSANGRLFYIFDEGLTSVTDPPIPERWTLIAREAFNGVLLWKRPLKEWGSRPWGTRALRSMPRTVPHRLVAGDNRLFVTLGDSAPVSALDAATGKIVATFKGTANTQEMRYLDGVLLVRTGAGVLVALDAKTGKTMWKVEGKIRPQLLAAQKDMVFCLVGGKLLCLQFRDGKTLWQANEKSAPSQLTVCGDYLLIVCRGQIKARRVTTGDVVWEVKGQVSRGALFIANNRVYQPTGSQVVVRDLSTGSVKAEIDPAEVLTPGHHPRCYPGRGTERFFITANRGIEFVDLAGGKHTQNDWTRGPCAYGILPCNGLLYVPPNPCFCYPGVKVTGFNAFSGAKATPDAGYRMPHRLETGPAYGKLTPDSRGLAPDSWPTYRHDSRRSGGTTANVPANLKPSWEIKLGGRLTQPVVANGRVYVGSRDTHTLHVLDEKSGKQLWRYTAGARIDSPPTVDGELVLFGCTDGNVYCLRAKDGELVWRFRAAPTDQLIVAFGQLESPWRVHGSVLVEKGIAYVTAGRSTNLDGGILVFGLDPKTGKVLHEAKLDTWSRTRKDAENKPFIPAYHMEGAFSDILVSEGGNIYLGQYKLDRSLKKQDVPYALLDPENKSDAMGLEDLMDKPYVQNMETQKKDEPVQRNWQLKKWPKMAKEHKEQYGGSNLGERKMGRHVFATGGFLDDAWYNRTFWMYSETWPGFHIAHRGAKTGQLLSVDDKKTYALQAFPSRNLQSPLFTPGKDGYLLFADGNDNEPVIPDYTRGVPKGIGFTRKNPPAWFKWVPVRIRAMVVTDNALFVAGPPDVLDPDDPMASFEGRKGGLLWAVCKETGEKLSEHKLGSPPVFDGMSAAGAKVFVSLKNGTVQCWE